MRRSSATAAVLVTTIAVYAAVADDDGKPILHQDIAPPESSNLAATETAAGRLLGNQPRIGDNPAGFALGEKILPAPPPNEPARSNETVLGADYRIDRSTEWQPDRGTGPDGTLSYTEVFNPSLVPFKRMTAMDGIRDDYTLFRQRSPLTDLPVGGVATPDRETFWGSLVIDLETGADIAIPSVAPDMRILSYEVVPHTPVVFSKDAADNYYLRSDEAGVAGQHRLTFLVDAPASYFAPNPDTETMIREIPPDRAMRLPAALRASAARAARRLAVSRDMPLKEALDRMTRYFRGFEAKPPPPDSNDIFWDLFESKAGVCRHRSFAFIVLAAHLGIPARYVTNEAHAWVEVWDPGQKWMRIDLGGAALTLEVSNAEGKTMHRPRGEDPFDKPPEYLNNYSRLVGDIDGLTADQVAEARSPVDDSAGGVAGSLGDQGAGEPERRLSPGPGQSLPELPESSIRDKAPTTVRITSVSPNGYRGEAITVSGTIVDERGVGLAGLGADVYIAPAGAAGEGAVWIGQAVTTSTGAFETSLSLPPALTLGRYEVFVGTPGSSSHQPAVSD